MFVFRKGFKSRLLVFLAVVGPGFITASVDNDAGGIWTYSVAGARFGYSLLWAMIPTTVALVVVQEMAARMGAITGKGLSDLIREEFGFRVTFFLMIALIVTNFGNVMAEFAGGRKPELSISRASSSARGARCVVVQGTYSTEKVFGRVWFLRCYCGRLLASRWKAAASTARPEGRDRNTAISTVHPDWARRDHHRRGCSSTCRRRSSKGITGVSARVPPDVVVGCLFAVVAGSSVARGDLH
jgi:hypothetical protein